MPCAPTELTLRVLGPAPPPAAVAPPPPETPFLMEDMTFPKSGRFLLWSIESRIIETH